MAVTAISCYSFNEMAGEAREKCAVAGVLTLSEEDNAAALLYESLYALQHRGAEASGIASETPDGSIEAHREQGLVRDIYDEESITRLCGSLAIGHNRYSTSGSKKKHPQPVTDKAVGFAMGHNGNIPDTTKLEQYLERHNLRHTYANDSEMMGMAIAQHLRQGKELPDAIEKAYPLFTGAFSCVAMQDGVLAAFRDPYGIRPLGIGTFDGGYAVSSESCGLDIINAEYEREIRPGELVIITKDGIESRQLAEGKNKLDVFEFVYFARHDSRLYGKSVNEIRRKFGEQLAVEHPPLQDNHDNIVVVPVPDTSVPEAEGYAEALGLSHKQAIIKNRYIGRTFMQTTNTIRREQLRRKHNIIPEAVADKDVIIIDDSIVRLNTMPRIIKIVEQAGARSVSVLIGSPPVRFPDFYGIDTPDQKDLAAANMSIEQMRQQIGSKYLGFLSLAGMIEATGMPADKFNLSCFTGDYPISIGRCGHSIKKPVDMECVD